VSGLDGICDVVSPDLVPTHQVLWWDEDASIGTRPAAGPAGQAVELFVHRLQSMARIARRAHGGLCPVGMI